MAFMRTADHGLQQAMALLIHNEVAFLAQLAESSKRFDEFTKRIDETNRRMDETNKRTDERFARIEADLDQIKAILLRHEKALLALPDAIREKIGFNPN